MSGRPACRCKASTVRSGRLWLVGGAGGAGFADGHAGEWEGGGEVVPDPAGEVLAGGVFQVVDFVEVVVVELVVQWLERGFDVGEVEYHAGVGVDGAVDVDFDVVGVSVQSPALVPFGEVRQPVSGLEAELAEDVHHGIPRYLWVCRLSR